MIEVSGEKGKPAVQVNPILREFRCSRCGKLLAKYAKCGTSLMLQVFCRRCGSLSTLILGK
jgi:hypothetical protein